MPVSQSTEYERRPATARRTADTAPRAERSERQAPARFAGVGTATHAILRIGAGLLFLMHGMPKLFGWLGGMGPEGGAAELVSLMGLAGVLEVFGGLAIVLGVLTRPVAVVLALEMLIAYFYAHAPEGPIPYANGGELALLYFFVWVYLAGNGAGPASVDRWLARRRARVASR
jgi:putative oxidoreductase